MKEKSIRQIKRLVAVLITIIYIAGFWGFFYPIKIFDINLAPLIQRTFIDFTLLAGVLLSIIFLVTVIFGRIYCSILCPLGLLQDFCLVLWHRKKLPLQKSRCFKYFIAAVSFGSLLAGTACVICWIDPYSIFASALSGSIFGMGIILFIAILTGIRGRWFCTNACPIGTALGIISSHAYNKIYIKAESCVACGLCAQNCPSGCIDVKNKTVNNETCVKCFKCLGLCHNQGLTYGHPTKKAPLAKVPFSASRRRLLINAAAITTLVAAYKAGIKLSTDIAHKVKNVILPAGAGSAERFANKCLNCNLCVENCPMKIIKKKNESYPAVHIEYGKNFCSYNCRKCSEICPSGALRHLTRKEKHNTQIGLAKINADACIQCGLCVRECPRNAITKLHGEFPSVNDDICIGCGACQAVCPVSAIKIMPVKTQKLLLK